jgi:hypothetical protein
VEGETGETVSKLKGNSICALGVNSAESSR